MLIDVKTLNKNLKYKIDITLSTTYFILQYFWPKMNKTFSRKTQKKETTWAI